MSRTAEAQFWMKLKGYFWLAEERGVTALDIGCWERVQCAMGLLVGGGAGVGLGWPSMVPEGAGAAGGVGCSGVEVTLGEWGVGVVCMVGVCWVG